MSIEADAAARHFGAESRLGGIGAWARRLVHAAAFAARHSELWPAALAGFLVRGGIVPLLIPILVLPSPVAIGAAVGVDAVSIAGQPTPWLVEVLVAGFVALVAWIVLAGLVGAAVDAALVRAAVAAEGARGPEDTAARRTRGRGLVGLAAAHGLWLVPIGIALGWLFAVIGITTIDDLRLPTTLAGSVYGRVLSRTLPAIALTIAIWVVFDGLAAAETRRRLFMPGAAGSRWGWVGRAARGLLARLALLPTVVVTTLSSVVAIAVPLLAAAIAFDWARSGARTMMHDGRPVAFILAVVALVAAWLVALIVAAATSCWRSVACTLDALARAEDRSA